MLSLYPDDEPLFSVPPAKVTVPVEGKALAAPNCRVPPLMFVPPVYVLVALRVRVPVPTLFRTLAEFEEVLLDTNPSVIALDSVKEPLLFPIKRSVELVSECWVPLAPSPQ